MAQPPLQLPPRGPRAPPFPQLTQPFLLPQTFYVPGSAPLCPLPGQEQPFPPAWAPPAGGAPPAPQAPPAGLQRAPCGCWFDPRVFHIQWSIPYSHQGTALAPAPAGLPASTPGYQHTQGQWAPLSVPCTATAAGAPGGRNIPRSSYVPTSPSAALLNDDVDVSEEMLLQEAHRLFGVTPATARATEDGPRSGPTPGNTGGSSAEGNAVATAPTLLPTALPGHHQKGELSSQLNSSGTATPVATALGSSDVPSSPSAAEQATADLAADLAIPEDELLQEALEILGCSLGAVQSGRDGPSSSPVPEDLSDSDGDGSVAAPWPLELPVAVDEQWAALTIPGTSTTMGASPGSTSPPSPSAAPHRTAPGDPVGHPAVNEEVPLQEGLEIFGCPLDVLGVAQDTLISSPRPGDPGVTSPARTQQGGQKRGHSPSAEPPSKRRAL